ncbi:MAG: type III-A CRISPR-associated RAMP protein Csm4 [Raineya sp.]
MRQAIILKCRPNSRFHLGETTEVRSNTLTDTSTYIHSDVLFSAFLCQMSLLYPNKIDTFIQYFQNKDLAISSAFYCLEHIATKEKIFFLPKPLSLNLADVRKDDGNSLHKQLKKIQFISWKVWQEQLLPEQWLNTNFCYLIQDTFVVHKDEIKKSNELRELTIFRKDDSTKICLHTQEEEGNLYTQTDLFLIGNAYYNVHWYFFCQTNVSQADEAVFWQVWENLVQAGIGGERSTGAGQMLAIEKTDLPPFFSLSSEQKVALSLIFPQEQDLAQLLLYQSKLRGGMFLADNYRLKVIQAVLEGAIHTGVEGKIATLHNQETDGIRLRNGMAFSVPLPEKYLFKNN